MLIRYTALTLAFLLAISAEARTTEPIAAIMQQEESANITWIEPTSMCDGSLPIANITGISIQYGQRSRATQGFTTLYDEDAAKICNRMVRKDQFAYDETMDLLGSSYTSAIVQDGVNLQLTPGIWYISLSIRSTGGKWSPMSNELTISIKAGEGTCPGCENVASNVLVGETGNAVTVAWGGLGVDKQMQLVEYGATLPTVSENGVTSATWTFLPPRAGLYYIRSKDCDDCAWVNSMNADAASGRVYYFKLASPTGGGIN